MNLVEDLRLARVTYARLTKRSNRLAFLQGFTFEAVPWVNRRFEEARDAAYGFIPYLCWLETLAEDSSPSTSPYPEQP